MSKHTAWEYDEFSGEIGPISREWDQSNGMVIPLFKITENCTVKDRCLAVSAQDLLEALEMMVDNFSKTADDKVQGLAEARAAIRKAKGE